MSYNKFGSKFLKGVRQYRAGSGLNALAIKEYLQSLDCPRALTVHLLFISGEHSQLANLEFNPLHFANHEDAGKAYLATKFLSKYKDLSLSYDLDEVAKTKFKKFELRCKQTNSRFRNLSLDPLYKGSNVWLHHAVIRKIERILGEFKSEDFFDLPDWGPGASTLIKRRDASSARKFQCETGITRALYSLIPDEIFEKVYPHWFHHLKEIGYPNFQSGNKVITVAKDATQNRVIAIEPGINLWFQKALGNMIGSRLLRAGIDLTDQSRNQRLARLGSKTLSLATVDLSSASDSIAYKVVEELLPPRWFTALELCRSRYGSLDKRQVVWEKFSSMGNGFTFQLESLIFYACALACCEYLHIDDSNVSVYGDDVIIPTSAFKLLSEVLDFYGFLVNEKKSHFDSTFRESCGAHYFSGVDLKPVYLKGKLSSLLSVFRLANAVRRLAYRRNFCSCDARFRSVFDLLVQKVPVALRLRIPETLGDGGFISNFDEAVPRRARHGIEGYRVVHLSETSKTRLEERPGYLLSELWRIATRGTSLKKYPDRDPSWLEATEDLLELDSSGLGRNSDPYHESILQVNRSLVAQWSDLGPWI